MLESITSFVIIDNEFYDRIVVFDARYPEVCYVTYRRVADTPVEADGLTPTRPARLVKRIACAAAILRSVRNDMIASCLYWS
jgi:hypothetical protein